MMHASALGASGLGVLLLLLPAAGQVSDSASIGPRERALRQAQDERIRAIASLAQLRTQIESGDTFARQQVLVFTEVPSNDGQTRDARLEELRRQVAELELVLEGARQVSRDGAAPVRGETTASGSGVFKIGLDDAELALIRPSAIQGGNGLTPSRPVTAPAANGSAPSRTVSQPAPRVIGGDPMRQARTAFHAGQYPAALALLEGLPAKAEVLHLRARILERQEELEQALGALRMARDVLASSETPNEELAERIRTDLEYLEWLWQLRETRRTLGTSSSTLGGSPR